MSWESWTASMLWGDPEGVRGVRRLVVWTLTVLVPLLLAAVFLGAAYLSARAVAHLGRLPRDNRTPPGGSAWAS